MANKLYYDFSKYRQYKNGEYMLFNKTTVYICIEDTLLNQTPITHPYKWQQAFGGGGGSGTVTTVSTAGLISGGPITTTGTITTSMNTNKLVGRATAGVGIMEEITIGSGLSLSTGTLSATGTASDSLSPLLLMGG